MLHNKVVHSFHFSRSIIIVVTSGIMYFFQAPRNFLPLGSKYSPQHLVLKHPQSMFFPWFERPSFTPIENKG